MLRGRGLNASFKKFYRRLQIYRERWWYVPLMGVLIAADLFVLFIPSDLLVVKTALLRPSRWLASSVTLVIASAVGAVALAWATHGLESSLLHWILGDAMQDPSVEKVRKFIQDHGAWALALISFSPLPQQAPIVIATLGGMGYVEIFAAVALGRAPKYVGYAYLARKAPHIYEKHLKKWIGPDELEDETAPKPEEKK